MNKVRSFFKTLSPFVKNKRGFTLIELIVVMSIMGSLVALASPNFVGQKERANEGAIQNDVMLAESKVQETNILNRSEFENWETFPRDVDTLELEDMIKGKLIYSKNGLVRNIEDIHTDADFRQIPQNYIDGRIHSSIVGRSISGVYFVEIETTDGIESVKAVYFFKDGIAYDSESYEEEVPVLEEVPEPETPLEPNPEPEPEPEPPVTEVVHPNDKIAPDYGDWRYDDFIYNGDQVIGLSQQGRERNWSNSENNLVLPDVNPYTGDRITKVREQGFKNEYFGGGIYGDSIEEIEKQSFMNGGWSGDFFMPNVEQIGDMAFMNGHLTGSFHAPNVINIGYSAFANSTFAGTFTAERVETIGQGAFQNSRFTGSFNAPNIRRVDNHAFALSRFSGRFPNDHNPSIGTQAFRDSQFANGRFGDSMY